MRDREYPTEKPEGVYRIALLGSSIDMGWGVATPDTYENRLEGWLNAEAARRHLPRRFEVLNFAMAAYGPAQRYEAFRRKALAFAPDLVLTASTMIDPRLLEIHLGGLIKNGVDWKYDFLREAAADAGIDPARERAAASDRQGLQGPRQGRLLDDRRRRPRRPRRRLPVARDPRRRPPDPPGLPRRRRTTSRALTVARNAGIAARHAVPLIDLAATFDGQDPATIEIAPGDDHPNALGHRLLFEGLKDALLADPDLTRALFEAVR